MMGFSDTCLIVTLFENAFQLESKGGVAIRSSSEAVISAVLLCQWTLGNSSIVFQSPLSKAAKH